LFIKANDRDVASSTGSHQIERQPVFAKTVGMGRTRIIRSPGLRVNQALPVILKTRECKRSKTTTGERKCDTPQKKPRF
jgi:hypothetical protein